MDNYNRMYFDISHLVDNYISNRANLKKNDTMTNKMQHWWEIQVMKKSTMHSNKKRNRQVDEMNFLTSIWLRQLNHKRESLHITTQISKNIIYFRVTSVHINNHSVILTDHIISKIIQKRTSKLLVVWRTTMTRISFCVYLINILNLQWTFIRILNVQITLTNTWKVMHQRQNI